MACSSVTLAAINAACDNSFGGIKMVAIANQIDVDTITVDSSTKEISDITMNSPAKFKKYEFRRNTGSYTSTVSSDVTLGSSFATTEISLQFSKAEATKRLAIQSAINAEAVVLVQDMYGRWLLVGRSEKAASGQPVVGTEDSVYVTSAVMQSGTANTDLSGFTMTLSCTSEELPHFLDASFDPSTIID